MTPNTTPIARAMIGVPTKVKKVLAAPSTPAMPMIEERAMQMMGIMIGARAMKPPGSLPKLLRSALYSFSEVSWSSSTVLTFFPM